MAKLEDEQRQADERLKFFDGEVDEKKDEKADVNLSGMRELLALFYISEIKKSFEK